MSVPKLAMIPSGYKATKLYSVLPTDGTGDFTVSRASTATRINKDGLIELVGANVPRLDYLNSSCPELLVEPQATQLVTYSNDFTNASWVKDTGINLSLNYISPEGLLNASKIEVNQTTTIYKNIFVNVNTTYTLSLYVKFNTINNICLAVNDATAWNTIGGKSFDSTDGLNSIKFKKISYTFTTPSILPLNSINIHIGGNSEAGLTQSSGSLIIYGAQLELGSVATSYIPNNTSGTITRLADVITGQTNTSNFNNSEGVLFYEGKINSNDGNYKRISINSGSYINSIIIEVDDLGQLVARTFNGGSIDVYLLGNFNINEFNKIAFKYKLNDFELFVNGVKVNSTSSGSIFASNTLNKLEMSVVGGEHYYGRIKQLQYYPTALTDTQLTELTT